MKVTFRQSIYWIGTCATLLFSLAGCGVTPSSSSSLTTSSSPQPVNLSYTALEGGEILGETSQTILEGESGTEVVASPFEGYQFVSWSDGVLSATRIDQLVENDITVTASFEFVGQTVLPIISIDTDDVAITSDINYTPASISIDSLKVGESLPTVSGGVRLRGHSTQIFAKDPYRIKFDKKQSLFGKTAAKSWVLLADYLDPSKLHNYTAFTLGQQLNNTVYQPMAKHVEVYLNDLYQGVYLLTEQIDEKEGRVDIVQDIFMSTPDYNFLVAMDNWASSDPYEIEGETYFNLEVWGHTQSFIIKYPEKVDFPNDVQYFAFFDMVKDYFEDVVAAFDSGNFNDMAELVDVESLTDMTLVDQIMNEPDHSFTSYYFSKRIGEKLKFGPTWDYDLSLGYNAWLGYPNNQYLLDHVSEIWFNNLFAHQFGNSVQGRNMLYNRWNTVGKGAVSNVLLDYDNYVNLIIDEVYADADAWRYALGGFDYSHELVDDNIAYLKEWLILRQQALDYYY